VSKMPLSWHKDCLRESERYLCEKRTRIEDDFKRLVAQESEWRFRRDQIAEAERRGLDAFDADRLLVKRKA